MTTQVAAILTTGAVLGAIIAVLAVMLWCERQDHARTRLQRDGQIKRANYWWHAWDQADQRCEVLARRIAEAEKSDVVPLRKTGA